MGNKKALGKKAASLLGTAAATAVVATAAGNPLTTATGMTAAGILTLSSILDSMPINKKTAPVETVSDTWKSRPKANLIKWLMKQSGVKLETIANYLGCSVSYLNTKLARDSFSFEDLIIAAYACGYTFILAKNDKAIDSPDVNRLDLVEHFENSEPEVLERINTIEEEIQAAKREEYERKKAEYEQELEKKKAELERLREEYGIEE